MLAVCSSAIIINLWPDAIVDISWQLEVNIVPSDVIINPYLRKQLSATWTMSTVQCTLYNAQCTVYSLQFTMYRVQSTVYNAQCTVYSVSILCTLCNVNCTLLNIVLGTAYVRVLSKPNSRLVELETALV